MTDTDPSIVNDDIPLPEERDGRFSWRDHWYSLSFLEDLPIDRPVAISIHDEPLVLFRDAAGRPVCLVDVCPHRAARLSDGRLDGGVIECQYHGWRFGADGLCLRIPQALPDSDVPKRARVRSLPVAVESGIVWVWPGDSANADPARIPKPRVPLGTGERAVTFQMDLPYDASYLIENVIDVAHIHIAHHGVRGGGRREAAKPLVFEVSESTAAGFHATFRSVGLTRSESEPAMKAAEVEFVAPNLVRYTSNYDDPALLSGLELYALPTGRGRCRLLYRKYANFGSIFERMKPRWLEHLTQCTILEQDMAVVVGQHETIEHSGRELRDLWLPLRSSDRLVVAYRRWIDQYGDDLPGRRGFATSCSGGPVEAGGPKEPDRHVQHTRICATCGPLHRRLGRARASAFVAAAVGAAVGVATGGPIAVGAAALSLGGLAAAVGFDRLRSSF